MGGFFDDLGRALRALGKDLRLPISTAVLYAPAGLANVGPEWTFVATASALVLLGFNGTQRTWYRALWEGRRPDGYKVILETRSFFFPFLRLGALFILLALPLYFIFSFADSVWARFVLVLIMDMFFTFITPALAFTTREATKAVSVGLKMLKNHWKHALPYVLVPPLVVQALWASPEVRLET